MAEVAVALLEAGPPGSTVAELAAQGGWTVRATTPGDHLATVEELAGTHDLVVGLARTPWPQHADLHAATGAAVAVYRGVVAWHLLPRLLEELAAAAAPGARGGAHLLVTAPDPGPEVAPDDLVFLREVAEHVSSQVTGAAATTIAWRGTTRTPTALDALTSIVTVHGTRDVVEVPVAPGTRSDTSLLGVAEQLGARLTTVDLATRVLVDALAAVVATVVAHELSTPDGHEPGATP